MEKKSDRRSLDEVVKGTFHITLDFAKGFGAGLILPIALPTSLRELVYSCEDGKIAKSFGWSAGATLSGTATLNSYYYEMLPGYVLLLAGSTNVASAIYEFYRRSKSDKEKKVSA